MTVRPDRKREGRFVQVGHGEMRTFVSIIKVVWGFLSRPTRRSILAVPDEQRRLLDDGRMPVAINNEAGVLMAAAGMGDGGEDQPQRRPVETAQNVTEID